MCRDTAEIHEEIQKYSLPDRQHFAVCLFCFFRWGLEHVASFHHESWTVKITHPLKRGSHHAQKFSEFQQPRRNMISQHMENPHCCLLNALWLIISKYRERCFETVSHIYLFICFCFLTFSFFLKSTNLLCSTNHFFPRLLLMANYYWSKVRVISYRLVSR